MSDAISTYNVPVTKAKGETVEVDSTQLPDESYRGIFAAGLKHCVNQGTTGDKYKKEAFTDAKGNFDEAAYRAAVVAKAREQVAKLLSGEFKFGRAAAAKTDHKLTVEATRLARDVIKQFIKDSGKRVTSFKASQITAAAKEFLATEEGGYLWEKAKENLATVKTPTKFKLTIEEDPELVAKNAEKSKKEKLDISQLSAAKAGKVKTRAMSGAAHLN